jgi:phosphonate transport system substrate-binding protein
MIDKRLHVFLSLAAVITLVTLSPAMTPAGEPAGPKEKSITLGLVSIAFQNEIENHFRDFVRYVARKFPSPAGVEGRVVVASTALQLVNLLDKKKVDFYMESPYPTYLINRQGAAVIILRRWKGGMAEYRSLIFTKRDSGITRIDDLRGKMIAFEDPGSTSGYFLPKVLLLKKGFKVTEKPGLDAKVAPREIGYVFEMADRTIMDLVLAKQVAAGAVSNDDYRTLDEKTKAGIGILAQSETLPRHLVSTRKNLDPAVKNRLTTILLSMNQDEEGRRILQQTDNTTKFDRLPGGEEMLRRRLNELFQFHGRS